MGNFWDWLGDHALLDMTSVIGLQAKQVTVRTKSRESQSGDSVPTPIPVDILKGRMNPATARVSRTDPLHLRGVPVCCCRCCCCCCVPTAETNERFSVTRTLTPHLCVTNRTVSVAPMTRSRKRRRKPIRKPRLTDFGVV